MNRTTFSCISNFRPYKMKKNTKISTYYTFILLPSLICGLLFLLSYILLSKAGEFNHIKDTAQQVKQYNSRYGPALHNMTYQYKMALYTDTKPDIVAFGSSRVMQFQASSFKVPFVNMGGISGLLESLQLSNDMLNVHKPKTVIWGLDFWWFNEHYTEPISLPRHNRHLSQLKPALDLLTKPYIWLIENKFKFTEIMALLKSPKNSNVGTIAIIRKDGYDAYGSYYYNAITTGKVKSEDTQFQRDLSRIKNTKKIYQKSPIISETKWQQFLTTLYNFQQEGIDVILFMPPTAPPITSAMSLSENYPILNQLNLRLSQLDLDYYDFHDAFNSLGSTACEFIDGHHAGAITYRRILVQMANASERFEKKINLNEVGNTIQNNRGYASYPHDGEIDFLNLGCPK